MMSVDEWAVVLLFKAETKAIRTEWVLHFEDNNTKKHKYRIVNSIYKFDNHLVLY